MKTLTMAELHEATRKLTSDELVLDVRTPGEWADFLELPFSLYKDDPLWVAPLRSEVTKALDRDSNPYFRGVALEKFVCYRDGQPVSRSIAVVSPRHWERFGEKAAFFGFFESENDPEAVCQLFAAIETYSTAKGARTLKGPFNPNHYSELGLLVENFETPAFFEPYNPVWYADLLRAAGFRAVTRLHTRVIRDTTTLETKAKRAFVNRTYRLECYEFPDSTCPIMLPNPPLSSVTHVKYLDTAGTLTTVTSTNYQ
ncbi:MAG: hypothetical protein EBV06_18220, partial [Planctomycetia bacterium]|nr:hypothetical protein [Planctomycetia bacterium]